MDAATWRFVRERAGERCEYCRLHQRNSELLHRIEHVVARQHGGSDDVDNLAATRHAKVRALRAWREHSCLPRSLRRTHGISRLKLFRRRLNYRMSVSQGSRDIV